MSLIRTESAVKIVKTEHFDKSIVEKITDIHIKTFQGFFLTFMGKGFLKQMYKSYCLHTESGLYVAFDEAEKPIGFLAYSENMSGLYKFMLKKALIPFAWYSLGAFLRKPAVFMRLIRALLFPSETETDESSIRVSSIGVEPTAKSKGIGTALLKALIDNTDFEKFSYITLETDAVDNEGANKFYQKNGFVLEKGYETREGRKMNEYRFCNKVVKKD